MLHDRVANGLGRNFIAVLFHEFVDHFVPRQFNHFPADRPFFTSFIDTRDQFTPVERLVTPVPLQDPEVLPLDFLVSREPMLAGETLPPPTDHRLIFNGSRIDHLIITSLTFLATHLPIVWYCLS